jgi:TonB-linked SusC/RagA family outer membrane protein
MSARSFFCIIIVSPKLIVYQMKKQKICRSHLHGMLRGIILIISTLSLFVAQAQSINATGQVKDETGRPVEAVSVIIKGKATGTQTDAEGKFSIAAEQGNTLVFSSVGFAIIELPASADMQVTLKISSGVGDEVVVVGYGSQRRVNMTGAVGTISGKELESRPVTNVSSALSGLSPGVYVRQTSGRPGADGAQILIRGLGTLSNQAPLILIDGIIGNMDAVNPMDIESISVLKDAASASIYGSLAANGVVLITTKKGQKNKMTVSYDGMVSATRPINVPVFVTDYAEHMRLVNEGHINVGQQPVFSPLTINAWDSASRIPNQLNPNGVPNSIAYPNTDWADALFGSGFLQSHNVSVNGGTDKVKYLLSLGYLNNSGTIENTGTKRFQFRTNLDAKVNKWLTLGTQTFASMQDFEMGNTDDAFNFLFATTPGLVPRYNGQYGFPHAPEESSTANNVLAFLNNRLGADKQTRFNTTLYAIINIMKGLSFESRYNYQIVQNEGHNYGNAFAQERFNFATGEQRQFLPIAANQSVTYSFGKFTQTTLDNVLRYNTEIGDHDIGALVGYNELYVNNYNFSATKRGMVDFTIRTLSSVLEPVSSSGNESDYAIRSWFGRVNYAYKGRYLLEGNVRRDGVSRFGPDARFGVFPSLSAGWRLSEEDFMGSTRNWLSNLKLRASWGQLGNNASGNYDWQATYSNFLYSFNNAQASGLAVGRFANPLLRWETTTNRNIGMEGSLWGNKLFFELDVYKRLTDGIISSEVLPLTAGFATAPIINAAEVTTNGIELTLGSRTKIGNVGVNISGNVAYNTNMVTKFRGKLEEGFVTDANGNKVWQSNLGAVSLGGNNRILEGRMINEFHLFQVYRGTGTYFLPDGTLDKKGGPRDGMIRTPQDLAWVEAMRAAGIPLRPANAVRNNALWYGDLIYADVNGDDDFGNSFDRKFSGKSTLPKFIFGMQMAFNWKQFDVSMIWAGAAGHQYFWNAQGFNNSDVRNGYALNTDVVSNRYFYDPANPGDPRTNINGSQPRLKAVVDPQNNIPSDFWLYDASWVKLRNLQFGYNLPEAITNKMSLQRARLFFTGENLLMFTGYPGLDPEIGPGLGYPTMKQFAFGVNVTFK